LALAVQRITLEMHHLSKAQLQQEADKEEAAVT
jgi:hypothetical protein